ncbi:transporter [Asanoa ishikariensis]|uniref:ABC-2 family transporter protein n=1 Tax=Asanoa ishikariensis TaxID=137265 RepID=A0A1H3RRK8_9ACTN|nr:ABC transporter permease subunit [Asanoa ishikariensis]GIF66985.1 transporter [Asanoa ishikariensis]SDZ27529.1 ABC-2 family transporter protein [Asanoa ishikariensis]
MIWFTWRQFRTPAVVTAGALAMLAVGLLVSRGTITDLYASVAACQSDCGNAVEAFLTRFYNSAGGTVYYTTLAIMYAAPPLIGIFWGAPLVAREIEAGTHRLAWNQSITRTRWLATKLGLIGAATAAATGLLSWAVTAWASRVDSAAADRITPLVFGARGIVPIAYALFAFTLGVTAGMLVRRTVPAMAGTLAVYTAAVAAMPLWLRTHLAPATHETPALDMGNLDALMIDRSGAVAVEPNDVTNAWTITNQPITPTGQVFTGPVDPTRCGPDLPSGSCTEWVGSLGLRQNVVYHPDSQYWTLQLAETAVFLGLAAALAIVSFWWLRRRLS